MTRKEPARTHLSQLKALHGVAKARAKDKSIPFQISVKYLKSLAESNHWCCALSKIPFETPRGIISPYTMSVDRIILWVGYVEGNVRLILHGLNDLKGTGTDRDVLAICRSVFIVATES